jgi:hypothetical protein
LEAPQNIENWPNAQQNKSANSTHKLPGNWKKSRTPQLFAKGHALNRVEIARKFAVFIEFGACFA